MSRINHPAVWVTVAAHQVLGMIWYSPVFLFNPWWAGLGHGPGDTPQPEWYMFAISVVSSIASAYVFAWLLYKTASDTMKKAFLLAIFFWLGSAMPAIAPHYAFAKISFTVLAIDLADSFAASLLNWLILGLWRPRQL